MTEVMTETTSSCVVVLDDEHEVLSSLKFNLTTDITHTFRCLDLNTYGQLRYLLNLIETTITLEQAELLLTLDPDTEIMDLADSPLGIGSTFLQDMQNIELAIKLTNTDLNTDNVVEEKSINAELLDKYNEIISRKGENLFGLALQKYLYALKNNMTVDELMNMYGIE